MQSNINWCQDNSDCSVCMCLCAFLCQFTAICQGHHSNSDSRIFHCMCLHQCIESGCRTNMMNSHFRNLAASKPGNCSTLVNFDCFRWFQAPKMYSREMASQMSSYLDDKDKCKEAYLCLKSWQVQGSYSLELMLFEKLHFDPGFALLLIGWPKGLAGLWI